MLRHHPTLLCLMLIASVALAEPGPSRTVAIDGLPEHDVARILEGVTVPDCSRPGWQTRRLQQQINERIRQRRRASGDYAPTLKSRRTVIAGCARIGIEVEPGPPARVGERDIRLIGAGADDPILRAALPGERLAVGGAFIEAEYERIKSRIASAALDTGYFDADWQRARAEIRLRDPASGALDPRADVSLVLDTGPRFRVREVIVEVQGERPNASALARYLNVETDAPWDGATIATSRAALLDSGLVRDVDVESRRIDDAAGWLDLIFSVTPVQRYEFGWGLGVATDTGIRVRGRFSDRIAHRRGNRYDVTTLISEGERELSLKYRLPGKQPSAVWSLEAGVGETDTRSASETRAGLGASRLTELSPRLTRTVGLKFSRTNFALGESLGTSHFLIPSVQWDYRRTDGNEMLPAGLHARFALAGATGSALSSTAFLHGRFDGIWARRLMPETRLRTRLTLGAVRAGDFDELPPSWRFYAGGDESLRGFERDELGPIEDGMRRGGHFLATASIELERIFWRRLGAAVFADVGNAFDDAGLDPRKSLGTGLRWHSPIGAIRLDLAWPVDPGDAIPELHFTIGRVF